MATYYVDSAASGANNGTSWTDAWTALSSVSAVDGGDTVYISGGSSGNSKTYAMTQTTFEGGMLGNRNVYKIGQEAGHNGTVILQSSGDYVSFAHTTLSGDAGDGEMHIELDGGNRPMNNNTGHITIEYVNCGERNRGFYSNGGTNVHIHHCYFKKTDGNDDFFAFLSLSAASGYDENSIHHCEIWLIRTEDGNGDDGLQSAGEGMSFYNNTVIGYTATYTGGQHQDGYQPLSGHYIKCYNNHFIDIANYPIFFDAYYGDFRHVRIYNNICEIRNATIRASDPPQGIVVAPDGGVFGNLGRYPDFEDIVIANNIIVDYGATHKAISHNNNPGQSSVFTDCYTMNNVEINSGGFNTQAAVNVADNITLSSAQAPSNFTSYALGSASNDYHLIEGSSLIGAGTDLSAYFTTDYSGTTRSTWDIGPYQFEAAIEVNVTTLNATTLTVG